MSKLATAPLGHRFDDWLIHRRHRPSLRGSQVEPFQRGAGMYLYSAMPPVWAPLPVLTQPLPTLTVLLIDLGGGLDALVAAVQAHRLSPWCPLFIVLSDSPISPEVLRALMDFPARAALVDRKALDASTSHPTIVSAHRSAPPPTPAAIADYVAHRTGRYDVTDTLAACLAHDHAGEDGASRSRSTVSRRLSSFGPLRARDWRALASVLDALHRPPDPDATIEQVAWGRGIDPRTLRKWSMHFLGYPMRDVLEAPGWKWKVEEVLRRFAYVNIPPSQTPPRRRSDEYELV